MDTLDIHIIETLYTTEYYLCNLSMNGTQVTTQPLAFVTPGLITAGL
jgi:hypothetical protein